MGPIGTQGSAVLRKRSWRVTALTVAGVLVAALLMMSEPSAFGATAASAAATTDWQEAITNLPVPSAGCFTANYPAIEWHSKRCKIAPNRRFNPALRKPSAPAAPCFPAPTAVGCGNDYSAVMPSPIVEARGRFANVSSNITETGQINNAGAPLANTFTLQLNTQYFATQSCSGSSNPTSCLGWQQFIYETSSNSVFIQYWLLSYGSNCPASWGHPPGDNSDCFVNSPASAYSGPALSAGDLATEQLTGFAGIGGNDGVELSNRTHASTVSNFRQRAAPCTELEHHRVRCLR